MLLYRSVILNRLFKIKQYIPNIYNYFYNRNITHIPRQWLFSSFFYNVLTVISAIFIAILCVLYLFNNYTVHIGKKYCFCYVLETIFLFRELLQGYFADNRNPYYFNSAESFCVSLCKSYSQCSWEKVPFQTITGVFVNKCHFQRNQYFLWMTQIIWYDNTKECMSQSWE